MNETPTLRERVYDVLESGEPGSVLRWVDVALIALIVLNVIAVMLESVRPIATRFTAAFLAFEVFSVAVFTVEYVARVWVSVERGGDRAHALWGRLRYMMTPLALIDLLAIAPFYLSFFIALDLRWLRMLRLLRVFKLGRYSVALNALMDVIREEIGVIAAAIMLLLVMMVLAAGGIYLFEHKAQPEDFPSIPGALWWAVTTLTTVGYGDVTPVTTGGRVFGGLVMLIGIVMVALPAGILASALSEHIRARRESYEVHVDRALADGSISATDRHHLERMREELGLSRQQANLILARVVRAPGAALLTSTCPHCGKPLRDATPERSADPRQDPGSSDRPD